MNAGAGSQIDGIAMLCDAQGQIVEVIHDGLGLTNGTPSDRSLSLMVDRASMGKALSFLLEIQTEGVALDWQLNVPIAGQVTALHFAGAAKDDRLLIVGAGTRDALRQTCEASAPVGNGPVDTLRAALAQAVELPHPQVAQDDALYDELSRLNNELVTLQRALAKKNVALEQLNAQVQQHALELERRVDERTADLQASEARFRALFEQAAMGVVLIDAEGRVLDSNAALREMVGCSAEALCGTDLRQFVSLDDPRTFQEIYTELASRPRSYRKMAWRFDRAGGQQGWANVTLSVVRGPAGRAKFVIGMVEDVTEKRRTEAALLQAEKLAVAGRLAASLAHEISNPLQTIIGCVGLAQESTAEGEDAGQLLQVAIEELRRVARVVGDLRELHRPPGVEEKEPANLNALLEQVLTLSRKKCEEHGVDVTWHPAAGLDPLLLVPDRIQQVFLNLVLNALDAMPEGGQLTVHTERTGKPAGARVILSDSGVGIPRDLLPHIFEPFYTSKPEGLGLGLFISQDIVQRHGGHIAVESQEGKGTTFSVWLPA